MNIAEVHHRIEAALAQATDTRVLQIGPGTIDQTGQVFRQCMGSHTAKVVADDHTFKAAGSAVIDSLRAAGIPTVEPLVFDDPNLHAYYEHVLQIEQSLGSDDLIPIAVGSGTINDLVKLAAHNRSRPYMVVATAASMDGYTAYGASINRDGSKQTFFCPAPLAVIADMEIISRAPSNLNAAGYADLIAKSPAGADWILADALGVEPINPAAWSLVHEHLREWVADPDAVRGGNHDALWGLTEGLLMTGFAMQCCKSSRPASGAEHQFSHLWDMQNHHHLGHIPLHGHKVGIGSLASTRLYEWLLSERLDRLDVEQVCAAWPTLDALETIVKETHELPELRTVALAESRAKYVTRQQLKNRLSRLQGIWSDLRGRLSRQLIPSAQLSDMLGRVGAPCDPADIGISLSRLRESYIRAQQIRRRLTVLDLVHETGQLPSAIEQLFGPTGPWTIPNNCRRQHA